MNILYYGMTGSAANPNIGWMWILIGVVIIIVSMIVMAKLDASDDWLILLAVPIAFIIIGVFNLIDSRRPIVKATLNDTISFTEIQEHYEYLDKEGDIYIFKPRNVNIDEWEQQLKEQDK